MSNPHYEDVIEWAKKNPKHQQGMMVSVYHGDCLNSFRGYGIIVSVPRWSDDAEDYVVNIEMEDGYMEENIPSHKADRVSFSGIELRSFLKVGLIRGGKC